MALRRLFYALVLARDNIWANLGINAIAVGIISLAMLLFSSFLLAMVNLNGMVQRWGERIQVSVYLSDNLNDTQREGVRAQIKALPEVAGLEYVSQEQALDQFQQMLKGQTNLIEGLDENPLPASFEVRLTEKARDMATVETVASQIARIRHVEEVEYGRDWLKNFLALIRIFEIVGGVVGVLVLTAAVFIISNTIKITIYSRRDEIGIMKLVGATDIYIRVPFMMEGMLQGLTASSVALLLLFALFRLLVPFISLPGMFSGDLGLAFLSPSLIAGVIASGTALGLIGSTVSFSEFLNV